MVLLVALCRQWVVRLVQLDAVLLPELVLLQIPLEEGLPVVDHTVQEQPVLGTGVAHKHVIKS